MGEHVRAPTQFPEHGWRVPQCDVAQEVTWRSAQDDTFDHLRTGTSAGAVQGPAGGPGELWDGCWSQ